MSKGSKRRPTNEAAFASGWDRIFGKDQLGHGRVVKAPGSNPGYVGSIPTAPAKLLDGEAYVADDSGKNVSADWWPGDE